MRFGLTNRNHACFDCRKRWRHYGTCPHCGGTNVVTLYEKVPPRSDVKAWEQLAQKYRNRLLIRGDRYDTQNPLGPLPKYPRLKTHKGLLRSIKIAS